MRSGGYKCYNIKCGSCMGKTLCGEPADTALGCVNRVVNTPTNADHIRAMSDEELADLLCTADWCETCDQMREEGTCKAMELDGPLNKHCVSAALRWLQQPYKEET